MPDDSRDFPALRYGSVCDGMGAAHVASRGLGWECSWLAEIDPAASTVTAHHYPTVPNLGDITAENFIEQARALGGLDAIVGGTPCQSFSIAGMRAGLEDPRGNLTLRFVEIADAVGHDGSPVDVVVWENVPGILSDKTNGFGSLLAGLVGEDTPIPAPRSGWTNAGLVAGPTRTAAWCVRDAQGFVAQRRRRVFVVAARHGSRISPAGVLLETEADAIRSFGDRLHTGPLFPQREGVRRDPAAGGSARQGVAAGVEGGAGAGFLADVAPTIPARTKSGGGLGTDFDCDGGLIVESYQYVGDVSPTLLAGSNKTGGDRPPGTVVETAETLIAIAVTGSVTHALNTANNGKMSSEDGTGRGVPIVAVWDQVRSVALRGREGGGMIELGDDVAHALRASQGGGDKPHVLAPVAFRTSPNCGAWETGDRIDARTTGTDPTSHLLVDQKVATTPRVRDCSDTLIPMAFGGNNTAGPISVATAINAHGGPHGRLDFDSETFVVQRLAVRRLMPQECLRLQSFPDDYFDNVVFRGKPLADGPRYRMAGNSWNVGIVRWIFRRITDQWGKAG